MNDDQPLQAAVARIATPPALQGLPASQLEPGTPLEDILEMLRQVREDYADYFACGEIDPSTDSEDRRRVDTIIAAFQNPDAIDFNYELVVSDSSFDFPPVTLVNIGVDILATVLNSVLADTEKLVTALGCVGSTVTGSMPGVYALLGPLAKSNTNYAVSRLKIVDHNLPVIESFTVYYANSSP